MMIKITLLYISLDVALLDDHNFGGNTECKKKKKFLDQYTEPKHVIFKCF